MIRRPPRSTRVRSSAASDVYKRQGYERSLEQELSGYLLEHARRRGYDLLTRPAVDFSTDERLRLGEFGIQTRLVKPPAHEGEKPKQGEEGQTMVYSAVREAPAVEGASQLSLIHI